VSAYIDEGDAVSTAVPPIVDRLLLLGDQAARIEDERSQLKSVLRQLLGTGKYGVGRHKVYITPTRRFDQETARKVLPPELLKPCIREMVDSHLAREHLSPELYAACQIEVGEPSVRIT